MENNKTKKQIKIFLPHQYDKEAKYLSKMAEKGWLLCGGSSPVYIFEKVEPQDIIFQLDLIENDKNSAGYLQIFYDAGWQLAISVPYSNGKWYYFYKKATGTKADVIYTDNESKLAMINRIVKYYAAIIILPIILLINSFIILVSGLEGANVEKTIISSVFIGLELLAGGLAFYGLASLLRAKQKIMEQYKNGK